MMSQNKRKIPCPNRRREGSARRTDAVQPSTVNSAREELVRLWKKEVEAISTERFRTIDEGIEIVVSKLAERFGSSGEEVEFLRLALSTDSHIRNILSKFVV